MKKILFLLLALPQIASAHAFGQLYNLPVPFWLYLYGAAATILVSFLIIGYFLNQTTEIRSSSFQFGNLNPRFITVIKIISAALFLLTIVTGLFGKNNSFSNFNMTFFWVIFVLGLTYLTTIIGNIYHFINPLKILTSWVEPIIGKSLFNYPASLGYYPALILYFLFIWLELIGQTDPIKLSIVLLFYLFINVVGVITVGQTSWFRYCEFFSVFFRLIGKVSPIEQREGKLYLRAPFTVLLKSSAEHFSLVMFIMFMLSSTAFDGFRETLPWVTMFFWLFDRGLDSYAVFESIGLFLSPFIFLLMYLLLLGLGKLITRNNLSLKELALQFAFTLIPIALVYNIAHYFTLIFTEAPNIVRLFSNPFGLNWNLLGTAEFYPKIILNAGFVWHAQVAFILLGHVVSVYLAHVVALKLFSSHRHAIISQFPMVTLMVVFTLIGLWILAQPVMGLTH